MIMVVWYKWKTTVCSIKNAEFSYPGQKKDYNELFSKCGNIVFQWVGVDSTSLRRVRKVGKTYLVLLWDSCPENSQTGN